MSFYKEVPGRKTTLESSLKFDETPTAGSTNPVTSEGVKSAIDGAVGDAAENLQEQIDEIAEKAGSGYIPKGEATVATLNALSGQENGELYTMTDAGTLTEGSLAVVAGDTVAWDATNEVWYKAMDYAPRQYGTNEVHNLPTTITAFRTGDVIPVDGPSGTAKMSKDDLLRVTAENAVDSGVAASQSEVDSIESNIQNVKEFTVPFFCVTDSNGYIALVVKDDGTTYCKITADSIKDLEELTENGFCVCDKNGYIGFQVDNAGNILAKPQYARMPRLILPERWNVVQGNVNYIFYESFLKNAFLGTLKIGNNPSKAIGDYLAFKYSTTGENSLTFNLYDENEKVLDSKTIVINVVDKTASGSFKICVCGDSKTDQASKLAELLNLCDKDGNLSVSFLGTQTDNNYDSDDNLRTIKNEGHSGMSVVDLCRSATLAYGRTNIFYDSNISATNKFNFSLGVTALGDVPDILWIDHGYNNQWYNPADIKGCYDSIIQSVADYNTANNTNVKVVISVQEWGGCLPYFYGNASGKDRLNDVPNTPQNYIDNFGDMEDDGVFICPQYFYVDPFKHYPYVKVPLTDNIDSGNFRDVCFDEIHLGIQYTPYNASTTYNRGDKCQVSTKVGAVCLKDGTQGVTPTDDKIYWALTQGSNANYGYFRLAHAYFDTLKYIASL